MEIFKLIYRRRLHCDVSRVYTIWVQTSKIGEKFDWLSACLFIAIE